jgi:hypothetical protein
LLSQRIEDYLNYYRETWNALEGDEATRLVLAKQVVRELYRYKYGFDNYTLECEMLALGDDCLRDICLPRAQADWNRDVGDFGMKRFGISAQLLAFVAELERATTHEQRLSIFKETKARSHVFREISYGVENTLFLAFALNLEWAQRLGPSAFCTLSRELLAPEILGGEHLLYMLSNALPVSTLRLAGQSYTLSHEVEVTVRIHIQGSEGTEIRLENNIAFLMGTNIQNVLLHNSTERTVELQLQGVGWNDNFRLDNVTCVGVTLRAQYCDSVHLNHVTITDAPVGLRVFHVGRLILDGDRVHKSMIKRCERAFYMSETKLVRICDTTVSYVNEVFDIFVLNAFEVRGCDFRTSLTLGEVCMLEGRKPVLVDNSINVVNDTLLVGLVTGPKRAIHGMNTEPARDLEDGMLRRFFENKYDRSVLLPTRTAALQKRLVGAGDVPAPRLDSTGWKPVPKTSEAGRPEDVDYYYRALERGPALRTHPCLWYIRQVAGMDQMLCHEDTPVPLLEETLVSHEKESLNDRIHAWLSKTEPQPAPSTMADKEALAWALDREREILHQNCLAMVRAAAEASRRGVQGKASSVV